MSYSLNAIYEHPIHGHIYVYPNWANPDRFYYIKPATPETIGSLHRIELKDATLVAKLINTSVTRDGTPLLSDGFSNQILANTTFTKRDDYMIINLGNVKGWPVSEINEVGNISQANPVYQVADRTS